MNTIITSEQELLLNDILFALEAEALALQQCPSNSDDFQGHLNNYGKMCVRLFIFVLTFQVEDLNKYPLVKKYDQQFPDYIQHIKNHMNSNTIGFIQEIIQSAEQEVLQQIAEDSIESSNVIPFSSSTKH